MQEDLYTPSLAEGNLKNTKSFEISSLFFVAFFGGIIAVAALGLQNAKWLHLEKKELRLLAIISIELFVIKLLFLYANAIELIVLSDSLIRLIEKGLGILCFYIFYMHLKKSYKEHLTFNGSKEPLLLQGIIWVIAASLIEGLLSELFA